MWHPHRCHMGDMQTSHANGQHSKFDHTCVSKLEGRSEGQRCKRCVKCEGCGKCEGSSHMCEHTLRIKREFNKVIRIIKLD